MSERRIPKNEILFLKAVDVVAKLQTRGINITTGIISVDYITGASDIKNPYPKM